MSPSLMMVIRLNKEKVCEMIFYFLLRKIWNELCGVPMVL